MLTGLDFALALCLGVSSNLCFCCTCDANIQCFLCEMRLGESDRQCPCEGDRRGWPGGCWWSSVARLGRRGLEKRSSGSEQNVTLFLDPFRVDSGPVILVVLLLSALTSRQALGREQRWVRHVPVGSGAAPLRACPCVCAVHIRVSAGTSAAAIHSLSSGNMWPVCACGCLWLPESSQARNMEVVSLAHQSGPRQGAHVGVPVSHGSSWPQLSLMDQFNFSNGLKHNLFSEMSFPVSLECVTLLGIFIWNTRQAKQV